MERVITKIRRNDILEEKRKEHVVVVRLGQKEERYLEEIKMIRDFSTSEAIRNALLCYLHFLKREQSEGRAEYPY